MNVFYFVITGVKQLKNDKPFPGADRFIDVSLPGMEFKIWYVVPDYGQALVCDEKNMCVSF